MSFETQTYSWVTMNGRNKNKKSIGDVKNARNVKYNKTSIKSNNKQHTGPYNKQYNKQYNGSKYTYDNSQYTQEKPKKKTYKYNSKPVNNKRLLCKNILSTGSCSYGNVCIYAHSIDEQILDPTRKKAYDMIIKERPMYDINLIEDDELFKTFKQMCYTCENCVEHKCSGGYNCRNGVCNSKYRICLKDLMDGNCVSRRTIGYCEFIHLTDRGLLSYKEQKEVAEQVKVSKTTDVEEFLLRPLHYPEGTKPPKKNKNSTVWDNIPNSIMTATSFKKPKKEKEVIKDSRYIPPVTGNLLTPGFLKRLYHRKNGINYVGSLESESDNESVSSIEDSEEYLRRMKEYHGNDFINRIDMEQYKKLITKEKEIEIDQDNKKMKK